MEEKKQRTAIEMAIDLAYLDGYYDGLNKKECEVNTKILFDTIQQTLIKRGLAEAKVEVMDKMDREQGEHDQVVMDLLSNLTNWFIGLNKLVEQANEPVPVVVEVKPPSLNKERLLPKKKEDPVKHSDIPPEKTPEATFETPKAKETPVKPTGKAKLVMCDLCKQEMTTTNYKMHLAKCKKTCPHCKQVFKKAKLTKHIASCKGYGPRVEPAPPKEEKPVDPPAAPPKPDENHKRPVPEFKGPRQCLACKLSIPNDSAHPYCDKCWAIAKKGRSDHPRDKPWSESKFG